MAEDGTITVSLNNLSVTEEKTVEIALAGKAVTGAEGEILTGPMNAHNTFDAPDTVQPSALSGLVPVDGKLTLTLPPVSVCVLHLQIS
jgi:alpha-N-arabinofuranosidase